ncbi:MAG: type II toxin-antitoxin system RelE/ParE family toxin [Alphaproteobacteria bacterium]|nr:type II toxin-antitoxin system RelE/ParE family toxin [Alphaproteobacteria bacterium]
MRISRHALARQDLEELYDYLLDKAGPATADRFVTGVKKSLKVISTSPKIGARLSRDFAEGNVIRWWRIKEFPNYLIFYQVHRDRISILRVLHGSRDWWSLVGFDAH